MKKSIYPKRNPGRPPKKVLRVSSKRPYIAGLMIGLVVASVLAYINFM